MLAKLMTAAAVTSLVAAPVIANPAASLSLSQVRSSTSAEDSSDASGGAVLIGVLATAAIIGGVVILADGDDSPDSP